MIKAIIFDFFGVICSDQYWKYVKSDRQSDSEFKEYADEVNLGDISWDDFVQKVAEKTNTSVEEVSRMYETEQIDPRLIGLIHTLKKNYKIGLLTNAHHDFIDELLNKNHLKELFDSIVVSSKVGAVKPNPVIFEHALNNLGIEASEAVFIDDIERNATAASEAGLKGIFYKDFAQAKADLLKILKSA